MRLFVGNLAVETTEQRLRQLFAAHGDVQAASVVNSRETGESRCFGFVEMDDDDAARAAIKAVNGTALDGSAVTVSRAPMRNENPAGPYDLVP